MIMYLFDSLTKKYVKIEQSNINIYTCGVTPYKKPHIGNLRTYLIVNIIENIHKHYGFNCKHVTNITDIGFFEQQELDNEMDKLKENYVQTIYTFWSLYVKELVKVINNIPIILPASCYLEDNLIHINKIKKNEYVVQNENGLYLDTDNKYFKSIFNKNQLIDNGKRINKFAIWKNNIDNNNIPGWHLECFSIIHNNFKKQDNGYLLEIHAGGTDLKDIHHNCEIIHYFCETKEYKLAKVWLHINLLLVDGIKMSKRSNNTITLEQILEKVNISTFMIMMLSTHYTKTINITDKNIQDAQKKYLQIVKNFIQQIIRYTHTTDYYTLINVIKEISNKVPRNIVIPENNLLINNINTVWAIQYLQKFTIKEEKDMYIFYIIDKILNTQIIQSIINTLIFNIDQQYLIKKNFKININFSVNNIQFII